MVFQECHLAHIPAGFRDQQDESEEFFISVRQSASGACSDPALDVMGYHTMNRRSFKALWVVPDCFPDDDALTSALCKKQETQKERGNCLDVK